MKTTPKSATKKVSGYYQDNPDKVVRQVPMTRVMYETIQREARKQGCSAAALIRRCIVEKFPKLEAANLEEIQAQPKVSIKERRVQDIRKLFE